MKSQKGKKKVPAKVSNRVTIGQLLSMKRSKTHFAELRLVSEAEKNSYPNLSEQQELD